MFFFTADKKTLLAYPAKSEHRVSYTVPAGVETIEEGALSYNDLTHITLPTSLKTIYAGALHTIHTSKNLPSYQCRSNRQVS